MTTPANADIAAALAIIAKLDNKQLKALTDGIKEQRAKNIRANKEAIAKRKEEAQKKRDAKAAEIAKKSAPLTELMGTAQEELFAERVAKATKPVLAFVMKDEFKADEMKAMKVAELRDAAKIAFTLLMEAAIAKAKAA